MRLVAEHSAAPANQTGEVIAEQAPARADIHDRGAVDGEVVGERGGEIRQRAAVTLSTMVGAVVLARALGDTPASDALLADVRDAVRERRLLPAD